MAKILESIEEIREHSNHCLQLYSGGLDSNAFALLAKANGIRITALHVDLGAGSGLGSCENLAELLGIKYHYRHLTDIFVRDFISKGIKANAMYKNQFPVCSSLSRPLMIEQAIDLARAVGADTIVHTAGYEQNTANRFNLSIKMLAPELNIGCPFILSQVTREEKKEMLTKAGIPVLPKIYSIDENIWGRVIEAGELDDPSNAIEDSVFNNVKNSIDAPKVVKKIDLTFKEGLPVSIDGKYKSLRDIIEELNSLASEYGVGRYNGLEDTVWGIKNHEVREAPAASVIFMAHSFLESAIFTQRELRVKSMVDQEWTDLVVNGYWHTPLREALQEFINSLSREINGRVGLSFTPGQCFPHSIHSEKSPHLHNGGDFLMEQVGKINYKSVFEIASFSQRPPVNTPVNLLA